MELRQAFQHQWWLIMSPCNCVSISVHILLYSCQDNTAEYRFLSTVTQCGTAAAMKIKVHWSYGLRSLPLLVWPFPCVSWVETGTNRGRVQEWCCGCSSLVDRNVWLRWGEALKEEGNKFVTMSVQAGPCISKLQLHFWNTLFYLRLWILNINQFVPAGHGRWFFPSGLVGLHMKNCVQQ